MNKIDLSIIVPVYNVEQYVEQCINSIKAQTISCFEVIIVDDGSKDSSISICERLIGSNSCFKILHKENGGLMSAWKYGLTHASGDYIGFVDSDDWIDTNMYEKLLSSIKEFGADVVCSGYITENNAERNIIGRLHNFVFEGNDIRESFIKEYCNSYFYSKSNPTICRWDKIYKRDILIRNMDYFNEKVSLAEDFNTNIAVLLDARRIVLLPDFTPYHYRYNPKSIVNTITPQAFYNVKELSLACKKICKSKSFESIYIDGFIGNIIFEEINRICKSIPFSGINPKTLHESLTLCNGYYYISCYSQVRNVLRVKLYNLLIQNKCFRFIKFLNILNRLR